MNLATANIQAVIAHKQERLQYYQNVKDYEALNGMPEVRVAVLAVEYIPRVGDHFLCVRELVERSATDPLKYVVAGESYGLPSGCIKPTETLDQAAVRVLKEETGYDGKFQKVCHIGQRIDPDNHYFIMVALVQIIGGSGHFSSPEILGCSWKTLAQLEKLGVAGNLRNATLTISACKGYKSGRCSWTVIKGN